MVRSLADRTFQLSSPPQVPLRVAAGGDRAAALLRLRRGAPRRRPPFFPGRPGYERCMKGAYHQTLQGSFSAVSKRNFASKYAFDSIFQPLQDLHTFAPLRSQNFSITSV